VVGGDQPEPAAQTPCPGRQHEPDSSRLQGRGRLRCSLRSHPCNRLAPPARGRAAGRRVPSSPLPHRAWAFPAGVGLRWNP